MKKNELPLQELFTKLREAGLPLGIDEYQLVLRSLQAGFGISDKAALKRLCQTLWVKSAEEKSILDYHFEQVIGSEFVVSNSEKLLSNSEITSIKTFKIPKIYKIISCAIVGILGVGVVLGIVMKLRIEPTQPDKPTPITQPVPTTDLNTDINTTEESQSSLIFWALLSLVPFSVVYVLLKSAGKEQIGDIVSPTEKSLTNQTIVEPQAKLTQINDDVKVVQSILQDSSSNLSGEFFPITQRQMKQIWRYLRRPVREGKATELDVEATINHIGNQGILLKPVLISPRVNRAELMLLIDQDGSMVPFHALSRRLTETALSGGRLGKTG
ncbi:MAG: hypothetical protein AAFY21_19470, partial [Cyanobacteria bacterium J06641_2]